MSLHFKTFAGENANGVHLFNGRHIKGTSSIRSVMAPNVWKAVG